MKYTASLFGLLLAALLFLVASLLTRQVMAVSVVSAIAPASTPQWITDTMLNPSPPITNVGNLDAGLAISPIDPSFVMASYNVVDISIKNGYASSHDAGRSWTGSTFAGPWGAGMTPAGDSNVAIGSDGVAYYTGYAYSQSAAGYFVLTSTNGISWSVARPILTYDFTSIRSGSYMVIDRRPNGAYAGSIYIFWIYSPPNDPLARHIVMRYSRDKGASWSADIDVSEQAHDQALGPWAAIGPDGSIYLAYTQEDESSILAPPTFYLNRSTDGGQTWGADTAITGGPITPIGGPDYKGRELVLLSNADCGYLGISNRPFITVSPSNANIVYAVWNDGRWGRQYDLCNSAGKHSDIAFSRSTDAGQTWSQPLRINDDALGNDKDQYSPYIAIGHDGTLGVTWYDRRYSADGYFYDRAYAQSRDGGATWSANQRISDVSSDPTRYSNVKGVSDLGSRQPLVFGPNYALPGWADTRIASQEGSHRLDIFVDRGDVCTLAFTDMPPGSTFYDTMRCLACKDILSGYPCGSPGEPCDPSINPYFRPSSNVTRGQIAKIVSNSAGFIGPVTGRSFEDVLPGSAFYTFTERLAIRGIMSGYPCGGPGEPCGDGNLPYFRPNSNATRGQISKIVSQAANFTEPAGAQIFEDVAPGSTFYDYIERLASRGYMNGYQCGGLGEPCVAPDNRPYFRPGNNATRGQTSKIVSNTFFPGCNPPAKR